MTTHERELTAPVDLCAKDGLTLNPDALGWSRYPLHRANLQGHFGINKRWDYWAILAGDVVISTVYADIDHLGLADVWWVDLRSGETGGRDVLVAGGGPISLPETSGERSLSVNENGLDLEYHESERGTQLRVKWTELDGRPGVLDVMVHRPKGLESLNVVVPWSDVLFNFTSKQQARPATGTFSVGDEVWDIGGPKTGDAWGVLDVGRGRWPAVINWNWGGGAGRAGQHVIGLQFGAKWTEGSGFTENGVIVDGKLSKIGRELNWDYDWDQPMNPWRLSDPGGQLDVTLHPRFDKHTATDFSPELGSEVHQVFGTWSGRLTTDDGLEISFDSLQGFAEEARQRW